MPALRSRISTNAAYRPLTLRVSPFSLISMHGARTKHPHPIPRLLSHCFFGPALHGWVVVVTDTGLGGFGLASRMGLGGPGAGEGVVRWVCLFYFISACKGFGGVMMWGRLCGYSYSLRLRLRQGLSQISESCVLGMTWWEVCLGGFVRVCVRGFVWLCECGTIIARVYMRASVVLYVCGCVCKYRCDISICVYTFLCMITNNFTIVAR